MKHREIRYLIVCASNTQALENLTVKDLSIRDRKKGYLATKYHYVITRDGVIEEGRSITDAGAYLEDGHSIIKNNNSLGVCLIGGSDSNGESFFNYSSVQIFSLNTLVTQLKQIPMPHNGPRGSPPVDVTHNSLPSVSMMSLKQKSHTLM